MFSFSLPAAKTPQTYLHWAQVPGTESSPAFYWVIKVSINIQCQREKSENRVPWSGKESIDYRFPAISGNSAFCQQWTGCLDSSHTSPKIRKSGLASVIHSPLWNLPLLSQAAERSAPQTHPQRSSNTHQTATGPHRPSRPPGTGPRCRCSGARPWERWRFLPRWWCQWWWRFLSTEWSSSSAQLSPAQAAPCRPGQAASRGRCPAGKPQGRWWTPRAFGPWQWPAGGKRKWEKKKNLFLIPNFQRWCLLGWLTDLISSSVLSDSLFSDIVLPGKRAKVYCSLRDLITPREHLCAVHGNLLPPPPRLPLLLRCCCRYHYRPDQLPPGLVFKRLPVTPTCSS